MSKLTVQEFVTIDGFAAAPDGALDFMPAGGRTPLDPQIERDQLRFIKEEVDTMLLGRTTYQIFIDYWPTATTDTAIIADDLNALSKVVVSRTLGTRHDFCTAKFRCMDYLWEGVEAGRYPPLEGTEWCWSERQSKADCMEPDSECGEYQYYNHLRWGVF